MPQSRDDTCPLCGALIPADEVSVIEEDMEADMRSCVSCGRTFREAREEEGFDVKPLRLTIISSPRYGVMIVGPLTAPESQVKRLIEKAKAAWQRREKNTPRP